MEAKSHTFACEFNSELYGIDEIVKVKGIQFPLLHNSATTGHKLQGSTVQNIFVNDIKYQQNWAYVVLSRVKTMGGLYLREKLKIDPECYKKPEEMKRMIRDFQNYYAAKVFTPEEYNKLLEDTEFSDFFQDYNLNIHGNAQVVDNGNDALNF